MADARSVNCQRKVQNSNFKTKITHTTVVHDSAVARHVVRDHRGPNQAMQKHKIKKSSSVGPLPSPPSTPKRSSPGLTNKVFHGVQTTRVDREQSDLRHGHTVLPSTTTRPASVLSVYAPLPSIGHSGNDTDITTGLHNLGLNETDRVVHSPSSDADVSMRTKENDSRSSSEGAFPETRTKRVASVSSESNTRKVSRREMRSQQFARRHSQKSLSIADEPPEGEARLLIAIKLPEGERLQKHFRPTDSVTEIVSYAEQKTRRSFSDCNVYTSDVPKRIISELSVTISDAGLRNRTLLYLEERDE